MIKRLLTICLMLFSVITIAQERKELTIQVSKNVFKSPYSEISLLAGKQSNTGSTIAVGGVLRAYHTNVLTNPIHYGIRGEVSTPIGKTSISVLLSTEFLWGTTIKQDFYTGDIINKKGHELTGGVGLLYKFNDIFNIAAIYTPTAYNPQDYIKNGNLPFQHHDLIIKLNYKIPFTK